MEERFSESDTVGAYIQQEERETGLTIYIFRYSFHSINIQIYKIVSTGIYCQSRDIFAYNGSKTVQVQYTAILINIVESQLQVYAGRPKGGMGRGDMHPKYLSDITTKQM